MNRSIVTWCLIVVIGGCVQPPDTQIDHAATQAPPDAEGWVSLFDGKSLTDWAAIQGKAWLEKNAIAMSPEKGSRSSLVYNTLKLRDGLLEVITHRQEEKENDGPITVTLRLQTGLRWSGIYFVCRRDSIEACRGSAWTKFPKPQRRSELTPAEGEIVWRFEMRDRLIHCYRNGQKVLTYEDASPEAGTLAVTADSADIRIPTIRYKALGS